MEREAGRLTGGFSKAGWPKGSLVICVGFLAACAPDAQDSRELIVSAPDGVRSVFGDTVLPGAGVAAWLPNGRELVYSLTDDNTLHVTAWPPREDASRILPVPSARSRLTAAWQWSASPDGRWLFVERSESNAHSWKHGLPPDLEEEALRLRWRGFVDLRDDTATPFEQGRAIGWLGNRCLISLGDGGPLLAVDPAMPRATTWLADAMRMPSAMSREGAQILVFESRGRYGLKSVTMAGIRTTAEFGAVREGEELCGVWGDFSVDGRWLALRRDHCGKGKRTAVVELRSVDQETAVYRDEFPWRETEVWIPPKFAPGSEARVKGAPDLEARFAYGRLSESGQAPEIVLVNRLGEDVSATVIKVQSAPRSLWQFPALWSPDGELFAWAAEDGRAFVYEASTRTALEPVALPRWEQPVGLPGRPEFWTWGEPTWADHTRTEHASYATYWQAGRDRGVSLALLGALASSPVHASAAAHCERNPTSCVQLGLSLWRGDDGYADRVGAQQVLGMACHAHVAEGCYELGRVNRSFALSPSLAATHWLYRKACLMGHEAACQEADAYARAGRLEVSEFWPARFEAIAIGGLTNQMCGLSPRGDAHCWQIGGPGRAFVPGELIEISGGDELLCGRRPNGRVVCWGAAGPTRRGKYGQFAPPSKPFQTLTAGSRHACGILFDGAVECWGEDDLGQARAPAGQFLVVSAGPKHTCGVLTDGQIVCWGAGTDQQQTPGTFQRGQSRPPAGHFVSVSAGSTHTCGVRADGRVQCWGANTDWTGDVPLSLEAPADRFSAITLGSRHGCGLRTDGTVACWGANERGQTSAPAGEFVAVESGSDVTCGLQADGTLACWGAGIPGSLIYPPAEIASQ